MSPKGRFSEEEADRAVRFIETRLAHIHGRWGGKPFILADWQKQIVRDVFGNQTYSDEFGRWVRQIRTVYEEIPRKNGKSELGAAIALKLLFADSEPGAQIYSVAEDLEQANIIFGVAAEMVRSNPVLNSRARVLRRVIEHDNGNVYRVIPSDARGAHGLNCHGVVFDELHTQASRELWDVLTSAQGARTQPLTWAFTTAGTDRASICYEQHDYGEKLKARTLPDDPTFHYIRYGLQEGDDWQDEEVWKRCNPALGDFLSMDFLRSEFTKAKASPARQNTFRNLYLNEWTQQVVRWLDLDVWDASAGMVTDVSLEHQACYGGLHIGEARSVASWVLAFPDPDDPERVRVLPRFFVPRSELSEGLYTDYYQEWERRGLLTVTEGNVTDYSYIYGAIVRDAEKYDIQGVNVRKTFMGSQIASDLVDAFPGDAVQAFQPTFPGYAPSTRELDRLLQAGKLNHGGNAILRWMVDNAAAKTSPDGDVKPDQAASQGPIGGVIALCMALDLALQHRDSEPMVMLID